jgi:hypothetical protein
MFIERFIWEARQESYDEAVAILKEGASSVTKPNRVLKGESAPKDQFVLEVTFDSLADSETYWAEWLKTPPAAAFSHKFDPLITSNTRREVWEIHEPLKLDRGKFVDWKTAKYKPGYYMDVVKLLVDNRKLWPRYDILTCSYGPWHTLALVFAFDSYDAYR